MDYQILHTEFNQQLFDLLGISESQWALGVAKYNEQYQVQGQAGQRTGKAKPKGVLCVNAVYSLARPL